MWKCDRVVRIKRTCHYHFLSFFFFFFFFFFFGSFAGRDEDEEDDEDDDVNDEDDEDDDGDDEDDEDDEVGRRGANFRLFGRSASTKPAARSCSWKDNTGWFGSGSAGGTLSNDVLRGCGAAVDGVGEDCCVNLLFRGCDEDGCGAAVDGVGDDCCVDFLFCGCDEDGVSVESDSLLRLRVDGCRVSPNMKRGIAACMRSSRSSPSAMSNR